MAKLLLFVVYSEGTKSRKGKSCSNGSLNEVKNPESQEGESGGRGTNWSF